jgi:CheY-like chemotaxis protein
MRQRHRRLLVEDSENDAFRETELHKAVRTPRIKVLFVSGYLEDVMTEQGLLGRHIALLTKPFTTESLSRRVRGVLDGAHA